MQRFDLLLMLLFAVGCAQGLFLCLVLSRTKGVNRFAAYAPALLILTCLLMIAEEWAELAGWHVLFPHLLFSTMLAPLLVGPLLLLHTQALVLEKRVLVSRDALHLIPFALALFYFAPWYLQVGTEKLLFVDGSGSDTAILVFAYAKGVHIVAYLVWVLRTVAVALKRRRDGSAAPGHVLWLRRITVIALAGTAGIYALLTLSLFGLQWRLDSDQFGSLFMTGVIYVLAFVVIRYPKFVQPADSSTRYANSSLSPEQKAVYLAELRKYMEKHKPHQDTDIRLADLADAMSMTTHHLSQVINDGAGRTFREFINGYRIEEVKQKLTDPKEAHKSILALAIEAGFGNKSSFNRAFRQHTGTTPSSFRSESRVLQSV